jgi:hypothetical protein
MVLSILASG